METSYVRIHDILASEEIELCLTCPECGSYAVTVVLEDDDGLAEYRCKDCGYYFVDSAPGGGGGVR